MDVFSHDARDGVDLEELYLPSMREIQEACIHLKTLIIRSSSEKFPFADLEFDHLLRQEIHENRPSMTQTLFLHPSQTPLMLVV
jgi:hypothetical protein